MSKSRRVRYGLHMMSIEILALIALIGVAALLGWASLVRARAHQRWARRRRNTVETLIALPAADWWMPLEVAAGWL